MRFIIRFCDYLPELSLQGCYERVDPLAVVALCEVVDKRHSVLLPLVGAGLRWQGAHILLHRLAGGGRGHGGHTHNHRSFVGLFRFGMFLRGFHIMGNVPREAWLNFGCLWP